MGEERGGGAVSGGTEPAALERASSRGPPGLRVGGAGGLRGAPLALNPAFCSVYCVESELHPRGPAASPAQPRRASSPASLPSPRPAPPGPDGAEQDSHPAREPFPTAILGLGGGEGPPAPPLVLMCRVCLEEKPIKPLPCCKKALCGECLKLYLGAQVGIPCTPAWGPPPVSLNVCVSPMPPGWTLTLLQGSGVGRYPRRERGTGA